MKNLCSTPYAYTEIGSIAQRLYELKNRCKIYAFNGDLGSGKTSLIRELLLRFGVKNFTGSPTFSYMTIYINAVGETLIHFDLYRLHSFEEFHSLGFADYIDQATDPKGKTWIFVEWPDIIRPQLIAKTCWSELSHQNDINTRLITIQCSD